MDSNLLSAIADTVKTRIPAGFNAVPMSTTDNFKTTRYIRVMDAVTGSEITAIEIPRSITIQFLGQSRAVAIEKTAEYIMDEIKRLNIFNREVETPSCGESVPTTTLLVYVQENGIIRLESNGHFIARLDESVEYSKLKEMEAIPKIVIGHSDGEVVDG